MAVVAEVVVVKELLVQVVNWPMRPFVLHLHLRCTLLASAGRCHTYGTVVVFHLFRLDFPCAQSHFLMMALYVASSCAQGTHVVLRQYSESLSGCDERRFLK